MRKLTSNRVASGANPEATTDPEPLHPTTFRFTAEERELLTRMGEAKGWAKALIVREALATLADEIGVPVPRALQDRRPRKQARSDSDPGEVAERRMGGAEQKRRWRMSDFADGRSPDASTEPDVSSDGFAARCAEAIDAYSRRQRRALTYNALAEEISAALGRPVAHTTVQRWVKGQVEPSIKQRVTLAQVLGVSPVWLTFGNV